MRRIVRAENGERIIGNTGRHRIEHVVYGRSGTGGHGRNCTAWQWYPLWLIALHANLADKEPTVAGNLREVCDE